MSTFKYNISPLASGGFTTRAIRGEIIDEPALLAAAAAAEVRATVYGTQDPGAISILVPAALAGPLQVRVAALINGSVRSYNSIPS